jgi:hypothetical protein
VGLKPGCRNGIDCGNGDFVPRARASRWTERGEAPHFKTGESVYVRESKDW